mgnify:FL=1
MKKIIFFHENNSRRGWGDEVEQGWEPNEQRLLY